MPLFPTREQVSVLRVPTLDDVEHSKQHFTGTLCATHNDWASWALQVDLLRRSFSSCSQASPAFRDASPISVLLPQPQLQIAASAWGCLLKQVSGSEKALGASWIPIETEHGAGDPLEHGDFSSKRSVIGARLTMPFVLMQHQGQTCWLLTWDWVTSICSQTLDTQCLMPISQCQVTLIGTVNPPSSITTAFPLLGYLLFLFSTEECRREWSAPILIVLQSQPQERRGEETQITHNAQVCERPTCSKGFYRAFISV